MADQHAQSAHQKPDKDDQNMQAIDENVKKAHTEAEKDIDKDADMQPDATDDFDEGELARLEGEN